MISLKETINIRTNLLYNNVDVIEVSDLCYRSIQTYVIRQSLRTFYLWLPRNRTLRYSLQAKEWCGNGITIRTYYGKCFLTVL